jgi:tryptophanyl-tRNA synthetase
LKSEVADIVVDYLTPLREGTAQWLADPAGLDGTLAEGAEHARAVASGVLAKVYDAVGFLPPGA